MMRLCWVFAVFVILGCSKAKSEDEKGYYRIEVERKETKGDGFVEVLVRFLGNRGYHWNTDFRPTARVVAKEGVILEKDEFSKKTGDFVDNGEEGQLRFFAKPDGSSPKPSVSLRVRFSMCTTKECRVFDDVPVEVLLNAK